MGALDGHLGLYGAHNAKYGMSGMNGGDSMDEKYDNMEPTCATCQYFWEYSMMGESCDQNYEH